MRKIASFQNIRNVVVFALVFLSQRPSPGPSWVTQHPSVTFDGKQKNVSVSKYATRIKTAFHQNGKEVHDDHSQQVSFSTSLSPFQTKSAPPSSVATQAWTRPQAKGLARLRWQSGKRLKIRTREQNGTVRFLNGWRLQHSATTPWPGKSLSETTAIQFLEKNSDIFNIDQPVHEWRLTDSQTDPLRNIQVAFSQLYEGLEVWPSSLTVQLNEEGHVEEVYGAYVPTPTEVETSPGVLESKARSIANEYLRSQRVPNSPSPGNFDVELLIHAPVSGTPRLAYSLHAHHLSGLDWRVFVDAHTGKVLSALNYICSAAVKGLAVDPFGHQQSVELWLEDGSFAMVDTTKSMYQPAKSDPPGLKSTFGGIFVYDANNVSPKQRIVPYTPRLISSSASDSGFGPDAVSASVNLSKIYDYYEIRHERHSIDGRGGNIIGIVNVPLANAYWQNGIISLGNVGNYARALDVVSHEVTHGVIESTADLIFRDQSGAISEAFSDIFGEAAEAFHNQGSPDWAVGTLLNNPLRNLRAPSSIEIVPGRPYPSRMSEFIPPSDPLLDTLPGRDNGGVHLNSTIISHAFYQLAEGLPESISLLSAERIFYRALTTKLQKQAQFVDCRIACVRSAEELFGLGSSEARQTALAFRAVEIFDQIPLPEQEPVPIVDGEDLVLFTIVDPLDGQTYLGQADPSSTTNPIVGAWQYGDGAANDSGVVVFLNNGIYFHAEDTVESGVDFDGMERGDYTWDETTGELDALAIVDTNGEEGLSESRFSNSFTATIAGDSLVINDDGERFTLGRVFSTTNPIVGGWQFGDGAGNNSGVAVLLDNGIFFIAEDTDENAFEFDGIERGTYTWDPSTGALGIPSIAVDTNGENGASHPIGDFFFTIAGDQAVARDEEDSTSLSRVTFIAGSSSIAPVVDGKITITFEGVLQESTTLFDWQDVDPQPVSPWELTPGVSQRFFVPRGK